MLIDIDNISVRFGSDLAVQDVSLCVHSGEFIGLIGPNGAGKTTLLRTLLGLIKPTAGTINTDKTVIAYVPQRGNLYNSQIPVSVLEVVMLGTHGNKQQAIDALTEVNLAGAIHRPFTDLSGGQQQRVIIAKALASEPQIIILDEPTTGIDEAAQSAFYEVLKTLQKQGITIIIVSHDIDAVLNLVTRVICLSRTILYDGPPEDFEADTYMPRLYNAQHRLLHHHHGGTDA
jgi:zinc transport system ATP-binding protein